MNKLIEGVIKLIVVESIIIGIGSGIQLHKHFKKRRFHGVKTIKLGKKHYRVVS